MTWECEVQDEDLSWKRRGACVGVSPDLFFPDRTESQHSAIQICKACPVKVECLEYAMRHCIKDGIWGGESERGRRRLRKLARLQGAA